MLSVVTTLAVLGIGVLYGVLVAVALSIAELLRRLARPHDGILGYVPGMAGMHDVDDYPHARQVPGLVVYRYDAPLGPPTPRTSAVGRWKPWRPAANRWMP